MSLRNDIMALTEAGEDARGLGAELFSLAQVRVCECVCPSLGYRSPPGLCERKSNRQRQKQNLTNSNMKQRAGHLAAARSLVSVCESNGCEGLRGGTFEEGGGTEREGVRWEKDYRERERVVQEVAEGVQGSI